MHHLERVVAGGAAPGLRSDFYIHLPSQHSRSPNTWLGCCCFGTRPRAGPATAVEEILSMHRCVSCLFLIDMQHGAAPYPSTFKGGGVQIQEERSFASPTQAALHPRMCSFSSTSMTTTDKNWRLPDSFSYALRPGMILLPIAAATQKRKTCPCSLTMKPAEDNCLHFVLGWLEAGKQTRPCFAPSRRRGRRWC